MNGGGWTALLTKYPESVPPGLFKKHFRNLIPRHFKNSAKIVRKAPIVSCCFFFSYPLFALVAILVKQIRHGFSFHAFCYEVGVLFVCVLIIYPLMIVGYFVLTTIGIAMKLLFSLLAFRRAKRRAINAIDACREWLRETGKADVESALLADQARDYLARGDEAGARRIWQAYRQHRCAQLHRADD